MSSADSHPIFTYLLDLQSLCMSDVSEMEASLGWSCPAKDVSFTGRVLTRGDEPIRDVVQLAVSSACCCAAASNNRFNASLPFDTTVLITEVDRSLIGVVPDSPT